MGRRERVKKGRERGREGKRGRGRKRGREGGRKGEEVGRREGWNKLHIANNHHTKQADETLECVS